MNYRESIGRNRFDETVRVGQVYIHNRRGGGTDRYRVETLPEEGWPGQMLIQHIRADDSLVDTAFPYGSRDFLTSFSLEKTAEQRYIIGIWAMLKFVQVSGMDHELQDVLGEVDP